MIPYAYAATITLTHRSPLTTTHAHASRTTHHHVPSTRPKSPPLLPSDALQLVDELDTCVSAGAGDQNYRWLFQQRMKSLCQKSQSELVKTKGIGMVMSVIDLLQQLLALRDVPEGDQYNDMRAGCMHALLRYYSEKGLHNMAMRYVECFLCMQ